MNPAQPSTIEFAAFVGLDWADQKHAWALQVAGEARVQYGELENTPEAVQIWASELELRRPADRRRPAQPVMYIPASQLTDGLTRFANSIIPLSWVIRTAVDPVSLSAAVQREILGLDSGLPIARFRTMEQVIRDATARAQEQTGVGLEPFKQEYVGLTTLSV